MNPVAATDELRDAKQALREEMRRLRRALTRSQTESAGRSAAALLSDWLDGASGVGAVALLYAATPGELDARPIESLLRARGIDVAWPRVEGDRLALHLAPASLLRPGRFSIFEPPRDAPEVPPDALALVVLPGLAFDRRGHRLGFGGGYYDRLLAEAPGAIRYGAALPFQLVERVPVEAHDAVVDHLLVGDPEGQGTLIHTNAREARSDEGIGRGLARNPKEKH